MAYITPITDRDEADIAARNSKAFLNVVDWSRIYPNSLETNTAILTALGISLDFDTLSTPTTEVIPTVDTTYPLNPMLANIERMRLWIATYAPIADPDFIEIKDDWLAGQSNPAPTYIEVNSWEKVLDIIYQIYKAPYSVFSPPITGVAITGADHLGFE